MLNGLDLFTGIGGISHALRDYIRPLAYCEIDPYCQAVILNRQLDGLLPKAPIWDDINTLCIRPNGGCIDIIYGGFPCQDISTLGLRKGLDGERSGLIEEVFRILRETEALFLFLENVPAITRNGGTYITEFLTKMGYDCRWCVISAKSIGALHKRERWFLLAHANGKSSRKTHKKSESFSIEEETWIRSSRQNRENISSSYWEENKCPVYGMDDGLPCELDRTKALGNTVVPQQVKKAFEILMGIKND
jgi:DNA (cytosine-5)-methyltransferase 1